MQGIAMGSAGGIVRGIVLGSVRSASGALLALVNHHARRLLQSLVCCLLCLRRSLGAATQRCSEMPGCNPCCRPRREGAGRLARSLHRRGAAGPPPDHLEVGAGCCTALMMEE